MRVSERRRIIWEVFGRLYGAYGAQGWWPVGTRPDRPPVYRPGVYVPTEPEEVWEIACGAVLTQNTSWKNVTKALQALARRGVTEPGALLQIPESKLASIIRSSGYFRQKARRLRTLAAWFESTRWQSLATDELRLSLLGLSGIGPETADSILLYAFGRPVFVVDAYTRRLTLRLGLFPGKEPHEGAGRGEIKYDDVKRLFERFLLPSVPLYNEYHALIVKLATSVCTKSPRCERCALSGLCPAGSQHRAGRASGSL